MEATGRVFEPCSKPDFSHQGCPQNKCLQLHPWSHKGICDVSVVYGAMDGPGNLWKYAVVICVVVGLVVHKWCVECGVHYKNVAW